MLTRRLLGLAACATLALGVSACSGGGDDAPESADLAAGKRAFLIKCGSCHNLDRAGTKGVQGPDLDDAFQRALSDGMGRGGIRGIVAFQIAHPARTPEPGDRAYMPADLVTGPDVQNVAAYVAYATSRPGNDGGPLFGSSVPQGTDGETIFKQMCRDCHTLGDADTSGTIGPNLDEVLPGQDVERVVRSIVDPDAEPATGYAPGIMPGNYEHQLRDDQVQALAQYLSRVAGR